MKKMIRLSNYQSQVIKIFALCFIFSFQLDAQPLYINEFMASNVTSNPEIVDFDDYSDWIELYNDSSASVDISGYGITDDLNNPSKWIIPNGTVIPSKGYLLLWADGYDTPRGGEIKYHHLNFKLSKGGEEIGLSSPEGELIDSVVYGPQVSDVSYGRKPDGGGEWFYFGEATQLSSNTTEGIKIIEYSKSPIFTLEAGFYSGEQTIELSSEVIGAEIRYTTDGSKPTSNSRIYSFPIIITENTVVRARVFENDKLPGKIITNSYFIDQEQTLPIISLTVSPETFFDSEVAIYDNQIKSREVPINVQYFEIDGSLGYELDAGVRLTGQYSFNYPQKPLTIEADDRFGAESINYPVFRDRPFTSYKSIYLRNSGTDDNQHTMFRDALQHSLVINQMDLDCQAYQPALTFINGEYWGIYNIREKLDEGYFQAHHNTNTENMDYLEYEFYPQPNIVEGSDEDYFELQDFMAENSMNIEENWNYVTSQIDVNEVMNYLISEIYCDNVNWPNTNSKWWREKSELGKWRYIFLDLDFGFGNPGWFSTVEHDMFQYLSQQQSFSTFIFRKLMENHEYEDEFIQRFALYLNTIFKAERVEGIVDSIKNLIASEMVNHIDRWKEFPGQIPDMSAWNYEVNIMSDFARRRPNIIRAQIADFFNLTGTELIEFNVSDTEGGSISVAGVKVGSNVEGEFFRYVPVKLEATPSIGYKFVKWKGVPDSLSRVTTFTPLRSGSHTVTAIFEEADVNIISATISNDTTFGLAGSPYYARGDVKINSGVTLIVESGVEILMPSNAKLIVNGSIQLLGTENQPIIISPNEVSGFSNWGYIFIDSASAPSLMKFVELKGATQNKTDSSQVGAISSYKSDLTMENLLIEDAPFPIFTQYGNIVLRDSKLHSEETCDLINIKYAETALVENCDMRGNNALDTDAIDYDGISSGIIRNNKIYNFYGFNSDGIDLGEGSKDIIIEGNLVLNCNDKGVSVGQASTIEMRNNIILSCGQGVGIKDDSSFAFIDRNTFQDCAYGVASFEKNVGAGGGNGEVVNTIISNSTIAPVWVDELSALTISYSLSDTEELAGLNNIKGDPRFTNNYFLQSISPAINGGNPSTELDSDGSIADIGAREYKEEKETIIFNEIHYNPADGTSKEFIEFYNTSETTVDLSNYRVGGVLNFIFPSGTQIEGKGHIVIAKNEQSYSDIEGQIFGWGEENLPNQRGNLILINESGIEVDFVSYSNKFNWPEAADGKGYSLELRNPTEENLITKHWRTSYFEGGSPGRSNKLSGSDKLVINEFQANNNNTVRDENGEYDDWIELYNDNDYPVNLSGLYVTDDFNNLTKYQIPFSSKEVYSIEPKEHFLLWADGESEQGINHLNFRLNNNGEELALVYVFENDTTFLDSISFGKQTQDFSYGRINDGSEEWIEVKVPTPNDANSNENIFKDGILLVNGFRFSIDAVMESYSNNTYWGEYEITFWDLLPEPSGGYPSTLPEPLGFGAIPLEVLTQYSTVIWTGANFGTELTAFLNTPIYDYVNRGGNLILLLRNGRDYLNEDLLKRLGISWIEPENAVINSCIPVRKGLDSITIESPQLGAAIFDTLLTNEDSRLLFVDDHAGENQVGIGVWNKPIYGGWYKEEGGQSVFISGRGYRYNNTDFKNNIEYILKEFFGETKIISDLQESEQLVTKYHLNQNYPNPFNPSTIIKYDLLNNEKVELKIYNVLGQEVRTLVNTFEEKGRKQVVWNGLDNFNRKVSTGIYFYRISAGKWSDVKKMLLVK